MGCGKRGSSIAGFNCVFGRLHFRIRPQDDVIGAVLDWGRSAYGIDRG